MVFDINSLNDEQKFALFYGILLGDGCLSHCSTKRKSGKMRELFIVCITGSAQDDREFFEKILIPLLKSLDRTSVSIKNRKNCGAIEINFPDKKLFDRIRSYGFPIGKKGPNISIPQIFYDKNLVRYTVAGFMATDGSFVLTKNPNKYYPRIEGTSISKQLLKQICDFMTLSGMKGELYEAKRIRDSSCFSRINKPYRFQFNGHENLTIFVDKIGFVNPKYQDKFQQFLEYCSKYDGAIKNIPLKQQKFFRINTLDG